MRLAGCLVALSAGVVLAGGSGLPVGLEAQRPLPAAGQAQLEALARESADAVAAFARNWLGTMHPAAQRAFRRWNLAVEAWRKEGGGSPASALAEGVLFDCLGRTLYLKTEFYSGSAVDRRFQNLGTADRLGRAVMLFEKALKAEPNLLEARFRSLRIRALTDPKAAMDLEHFATSQEHAELSYLAAVSRAAIAHERAESATAVRWYQHALKFDSRSTAAVAGLSALKPEIPVDFDSLSSEDVYYNYPCRVLTTSVATELTERIAKLPPR